MTLLKSFFDWSVIEEEDWLTSWKKYWGPEVVGRIYLYCLAG